MRQSSGCAVPGREQYVCRLKRRIFGNQYVAGIDNPTKHYRSEDSKPSGSDPCLYVKNVGTTSVFLLIDMLIGSTDARDVKRLFDSLKEECALTCLSED